MKYPLGVALYVFVACFSADRFTSVANAFHDEAQPSSDRLYKKEPGRAKSSWMDEALIALERVMTYRVKTIDPQGPTTGSPLGEHQYWTVSDAELEGPEIHARLAAPGMDWLRIGTDGFWRPNVRALFKTDDGELIWLHYSGLVQQSEAFRAAASANRETQWGDQYMRLMMHFDTGAPRYRWLNTTLFVAAGRLLGTGTIEYSVHRLL